MPHGYHGPSMAAPGYDLYYLNVMAGAGRARVALHRRPRARVDPRDVGGAGPRPAAAVDRRAEEDRMRLTVAQALVRFLAAQHIERDGVRAAASSPAASASSATATSPGSGRRCSSSADALPYHHGAQRAGDGPRRRRLRAPAQPARRRFACTTSVGPGATNMVTGAALATINRLPVLLLPGRHVRDPHAAPGAAAARGRRTTRRCRSTTASGRCRASTSASSAPEQLDPGAARGDARADRPGRDRRGDARAARGRAGRGVRLAGGAVRASASGTSAARRPSPRRSPARPS